MKLEIRNSIFDIRYSIYGTLEPWNIGTLEHWNPGTNYQL
jgi:hypothetical protein